MAWTVSIPCRCLPCSSSGFVQGLDRGCDIMDTWLDGQIDQMRHHMGAHTIIGTPFEAFILAVQARSDNGRMLIPAIVSMLRNHVLELEKQYNRVIAYAENYAEFEPTIRCLKECRGEAAMLYLSLQRHLDANAPHEFDGDNLP